MTWDPNKYNEFKEDRYKPFGDLTSHIVDKPNLKVIDLGCGTGELTQKLSNQLTDPVVLGIDSSAEMLAKAPHQENIQFRQFSISEQLEQETKWDLIFSNAALQWVDHHEELFTKIISRIKSGGQLVIQMPQQTENVLNKILLDLVQEEPYASYLNHWTRPSPVLTLDQYAKILFDNGGQNLVLYQKVYPLISTQQDSFFDFISGSALTVYQERLKDQEFQELSNEFKKRINLYFPAVPSIYAFKRLLMYATF
ncbi:methyltransferase domain-containing protein [Flavobacterium sp. Fl-318]|uniref:Methyltransferase domain-containing protein n=1 Tax=Flavobacterium cupriresistens TaxID=2893885 RepID=A0ABU4RB13_9FLAO|nr:MULTISPECIES: methyltransferase domain-containing protein [unclassified Flavobacterium]MDX6188680.1 methyltransferase domain-containing protein [Flavobacterium sp. Fl-318]UFH44532.1 methyltransferase domain-containing protein [Flavobacterium sp. F-323]